MKIIRISICIIMLVALSQTVYANLTISIGSVDVTRYELSYALYAANGREWYVDNILFSDHKQSVSVYFAPAGVVSIASRDPIEKNVIIGIKRAIDFLAENGETLYVNKPMMSFDMGKASRNRDYLSDCMEGIYNANYMAYFFLGWRTVAQFGRLTPDNSKKLVQFFFDDFMDKMPYGYILGDESEGYKKYVASCERNGVVPIVNDYKKGRSCYTEADVDHYLEFWFGTKDSYNKVAKRQDAPLPLFDYSSNELNTDYFQLFQTTSIHGEYDYSKRPDKHVQSALYLGVYPQAVDPKGILRSVSMINKSLYDSNGRDWYVEHMLFGSQRQSHLYFLKEGHFSYTSYECGNFNFADGIIKAIDRMAEKSDTIFAPIYEWPRPYGDSERDSVAINKWLASNLICYLFDDDWKSRIESGKRAQKRAVDISEKITPFGLKDISLYPRLDNGTMEGRIFRHAYEKSCKEKHLKMLGGSERGQRRLYSDDEIDLYLEWVMKADDYYISLPAPSVYRIMDFEYSNYSYILDKTRLLTVREVCKQ